MENIKRWCNKAKMTVNNKQYKQDHIKNMHISNNVVSGQVKRWSDTLKWFIGSKFTSYGMIGKINKTWIIISTVIYRTEMLVARLPSGVKWNGLPAAIAFVEAIRYFSEMYEQALLQSAWCSQQMDGQPRAAVIIDTPFTSADGLLAPHSSDYCS